MMWGLFLLLSLDVTLAVSDKVPNFAVFIPPDLYYPSNDTFCIHTSDNLRGFSEISVDLKTSSGTINLYTAQGSGSSWRCQTFPVPEPAADTETVDIVVRGKEAAGSKTELSTKSLTLRRKSHGTFIQTDKPKYKPGDNVKFRIVTVDQDMAVRNDNYPLVELQDPNKNRLAQWKDVSPNNGIVDLSYQLSSEPPQGPYTIKAGNIIKEFTVEEYVLPRFEVMKEIPAGVTILDKELPVSVHGKYTFGEKVPGEVTLKMCQKKVRYWYYWSRSSEEEDKDKSLCHTETAKTDQSGNLKTWIKLSQFKLRDSGYARQLDLEVTLEEAGTGIKVTSSTKRIQITPDISKLSFKDTKSYYQPGAPYRGKLLLESHDGKPLSGQTVHLSISRKGDALKETFITDSSGEVPFQLSTSDWGKGSVTLRATTNDTNGKYERGKVTPRYGQSTLYLKDIHVETANSLYIRPVKSSARCHESVTVTVDYTIGEEEKDNLDIFYLVLVNNKITLGGQKKVDALSGSVVFSLPIRDISPSGKLLVFTVSPSGGVAADTTTLQVTPCLKHEVSLKFSVAEALPGSDVKLHLQANGGSMCAVRAVDKSVVLMNPEAELTESKIQKLVPPMRTYISNYLHYSLCSDKNPQYNSDSSDFGFRPWMWRSYPEKKMDVQNIINELGLYILSSWKIVAPVTCKEEHGLMDMLPVSGLLMAPSMARAPTAMMTATTTRVPLEAFMELALEDSDSGGTPEIRTHFPESWIWLLQPVDSSGNAEIPVTVPDTITQWSAQMFCAGPGGLGLSAKTPLKAFLPLFVDMNLPYSVHKGESFILKASAFNYMSAPAKIMTTLSPSNEFTVKNNIANQDPFCLGPGEKRTLSWEVTPTIIGQMNVSVMAEAVKSQDLCGGQETVIPQKGKRDVVIRSLLVQPEGTLVEQTHNSMLLCEGNSVSEEVNLDLPSSYVPGSEKAYISICGDIMGPAMNNLDNLLAMSYGCGEQNMVRFAPNVYVLQSLKNSGQLHPSILQKGKKFLESGFQRQLTYKHPDGCYSAFGKSDKEGSTWLTAFVMKSFSQARVFMFIDDNHMHDGFGCLKRQQKSNGCFKASGRLLQNSLKGGVDDETTLTAYVIAALMEACSDPSDPVVKKALECIKNESLEEASPYKLAIMSYAFTLAKQPELRAATLQKLEEQATKTDGFMYWTQESKPDTKSYWSKPSSLNVEMTSYALLSLASNGPASKKEMKDMIAMVRWLSKQQNANGGFSSTQDTVVGIQSLAKFASLTMASAGSVTMQVASEKGLHHRFQVNNDNRLLLQSAPLQDIPGKYTVTATGNGTVFMQVVQRYHTPPLVQKAAFELSAETNCVKHSLGIKVHLRYIGTRPASNMALVEVKLLSGFSVQKDGIEKLKKKPLVKRVETSEDKVTIYIEKVTSEAQTLEIMAEKNVQVSGLKPAIIKVFDYYLPDEEKTIDYLSTC